GAWRRSAQRSQPQRRRAVGSCRRRLPAPGATLIRAEGALALLHLGEATRNERVPIAVAGRRRRYSRGVARRTGRKLLQFDRRLGARFVAGADEAGRGPLAGPLLVAGVLLDYARLRDHRVRPLACLNDSKQCSEAEREQLFRAIVGCAERI